MKKVITLFLLASLFFNGEAKHVSKDEALLKAKDFLKKELKEDNLLKKKSHVEESHVNENFYIFNALDRQGFVIVSADDCAPSILGYSFNNQISEEQLPGNVEWLLQYYNKSIGLLKSNNIKAQSLRSKDPITPIILTQWGQGYPYNELCPQLNPEEQCLTGSLATAMAQVIYHNRWPQGQTSRIQGYVTETYKLDMPQLEPTIFDWDNMTTSDIARLMLYCGQAVFMDYSPYTSVTYFPRTLKAMADVFGYSKAMTFMNRFDYNNDDAQWDNLVYGELKNGFPILYRVNGYEGEAFIVDGYEDGKFHINWGWDGNCDGYYLLTGLNPIDSEDFNSGQGFISNAFPPVDPDNIQRPKTVINSINCPERNLQRESNFDSFPSINVIAFIQSILNVDAKIETGIALYDDNGMVELMHSEIHDFIIDEEYLIQKEIVINSNVPDGNYRIVTVNRMSESDNWLMDAGAESRYIQLTIEGNDMFIERKPVISSDSYTLDFGYHQIEGVNYQLISEFNNLRARVCNSKDYSGDLFIPEYVQYQNKTFKVEYIDDLSNLPNLTSLSIPVGCNIYYNPNLQSIELRESVINFYYNIYQCPSLKEITYPKNCFKIKLPFDCEALERIIIKNQSQVQLYLCGDNSTWDNSSLTSKHLPSLKDIYFLSDFPPKLYESYGYKIDSFDMNPDVTIHVPIDTSEAYKSNGWKEWNIVEDQPAIPNNVEWDYCGKDDCSSLCVVCDRGDNNVEYAIFIPSEYLQAYVGCNISAIEYRTTTEEPNDDHFQDIEYVFITTTDEDYLVKKNVVTKRGCWMRVELDEPYVINGDELFIGVGKLHVLGMVFANDEIVPNGFWIRAMGKNNTVPLGVWEQITDIYYEYHHPMPIRAIITGENLPNDITVENLQIFDKENNVNNENTAYSHSMNLPQRVSVPQHSSNNEVFTYTITNNHNLIIPSNNSKELLINDNRRTNKANNETRTLNFKIKNRSPHKVKEVVFDYEFDGKIKGSFTHNTNLLTNHSEYVSFEIPDQIRGRSHNINLSVSSIDGQPDDISINSEVNTCFFVNVEKNFPRKIVMEEATGTWCGYCPLGIAFMETMKKKYPDNFIGIAIHDDELSPAFDSYNPFFAQVSSFPSAIINRSHWIHLIPFEIDEENNKTEALVNTSARFLPGGEKVEVTTKTTFGFDDYPYDNYRLAYVLVENNVGPLYQANYYSDPGSSPEDDEGLNWWVKQDSYVEILFNDVARAIYEYDGIPESFTNTIIKDEEYVTNYKLQLPDNIQNVENLSLVALLIDTATGEIMNADIADIEDDKNVGIESLIEESESFDVYNLMGIKIRNNVRDLNSLPEGIYIVNNKKIKINSNKRVF